MSRLGLRARLALALVAVLAIGVATVLSDLGLRSRLSTSAHSRLERSAQHFAEVTAVVYCAPMTDASMSTAPPGEGSCFRVVLPALTTAVSGCGS